MVVLGVVLIVVVGPRELPKLLRSVGSGIRKLRDMSSDLREQSGIDDIINEEGLREDLDTIRSLSKGRVVDSFVNSSRPRVRARPRRVVAKTLEQLKEPEGERPPRQDEYPTVGPDAAGALPDDATDEEVAAALAALEKKEAEAAAAKAEAKARAEAEDDHLSDHHLGDHEHGHDDDDPYALDGAYPRRTSSGAAAVPAPLLTLADDLAAQRQHDDDHEDGPPEGDATAAGASRARTPPARHDAVATDGANGGAGPPPEADGSSDQPQPEEDENPFAIPKGLFDLSPPEGQVEATPRARAPDESSSPRGAIPAEKGASTS